jgi:uncharacterized protein YceH (UPF0502 family)
MSSDVTPQPPAPPPPPAPTWEPLSVLERRVLGVLIEKQKTSRTADAYPLTLNALTVGCNQKSNRDPVLDLTDDEIDEVVQALQKKGLVTRVTGSRVDRFRHELYEVWTRNGPQLAVIAELLLRGPQTKGELRGRAARMDPIDTLDALDNVIKPLVERRLVVHLGEPDRRGSLVTHGFHTPDELTLLRAGVTASGPLDAGAPTAVRSEVGEEIARLKAAVATLEAQMADVRKRLGLA